MSTITKEWLQQTIAEMEAACDEILLGLDEDDSNTLAAMRIALASLEAEPVAYMYKDNLHSDARFSLHTRFGNWSQEDINEYEITEIPLYAAPPAPVALPVQHWEELCRQNPDMSIGDAIIRAAWWNHCAAMLQGAGVTKKCRSSEKAQVLQEYPETLPCPVFLEPGLRFGKGVPTRTMLGALRRRSEYYSELEAMTPEQLAEHEAGMKEFAAMLQRGKS